MLTLKKVTKQYDHHTVVDSIDLTVEQGNKLVLIGMSGSGKTTLLKMINRLITLTSGTIHVNGTEIHAWEPVNLRRHLGYVIQEVGLFPHYTIEENVALIPEILGWNKDRTRTRVSELLELVGIDPALYRRKPVNLSGGQQQRVGIARALAADPGIILMDEPFGALDPITRHTLQREFIGLPGMEDKTVIIVTHDMEEAALLGDTICLIDAGKIQQLGRLTDLLFRPANGFVSDFLKNHRDQLELQAITLEPVLRFLPAAPQDLSLPQLPASMSLQQAIAQGEAFTVQGIQEVLADPDSLRSTYYRHRREIIDGMS